MTNNPSTPILLADRLKQVADEQQSGAHFEGESKRERRVGRDRAVVVDIFKRANNPYKRVSDQTQPDMWKPHSYFMRVSLRDPIRTDIITRYEIDIDRYQGERELLAEAFKGGGLVATAQIENRGATWDPNEIAKLAAEAMKELLQEIQDPDKTTGF
jgi:hypothetical protein